LAAIRLDPGFNNGHYYDAADDAGPHRGLAIARQIAHTTYRTATELDERFQRFPQYGEDPFVDGRYAIQSYLDHHGDKLARRFDANSYIVLTESMLTHDIGRDRGGTDTALASITAKTLVVAVDSDRLYPISQAERIAALVPGSKLEVIHSPYGHDGFLLEFNQLDPMIREFLGALEKAPAAVRQGVKSGAV
jgi:homoserine O-acetyltransferase